MISTVNTDHEDMIVSIYSQYLLFNFRSVIGRDIFNFMQQLLELRME